MTTTRRELGALLGAILLAGLTAGCGAARADLKEIEAAARKEGSLTWYTAHTDGEAAEAMGRAFTAAYPEIKVVVIRLTAQVAYQRLLQDLKNNVAQCDVFSSTDVGHYVALKAQGKLARYTPENAAKVLPAFRDVDPEGTFHATSAGLVLITYNTAKVKPEEAPKNWPDLVDPKWKDKVSVGHPAFSGYVGTWVMMMRKLYGWDYFKKLEANNPQIGRSIVDTVTMLNSGERQVAAGPSATTLKSLEKGNPVALVYPTDGAILMVSPSGIVANAPHPNAARLFMEFLLGEEIARLSVDQGMEPMRPEVKPRPGSRSILDVKVLRPTIEEVEKGIPEVIEQWRDTFGG
jgi:iron(III) transport system substrate-binding protein